jgi:hypothetical protein
MFVANAVELRVNFVMTPHELRTEPLSRTSGTPYGTFVTNPRELPWEPRHEPS